MKNLVGSLKVHFGKLAILLLASFALFTGVSCKQKNTTSQGEGKPILTSLIIDEKKIEIKDEMYGGETVKNRVKVAYTFSPSDATIAFEPKLNNESKWELVNFGENILKITVKKGKDEKVYTFKYIKESMEALKSLKIGRDIKRVADQDGMKAGINPEMEFVVDGNATEVPIEIELKEGATAKWETVTEGAPEVQNNKITFATTTTNPELFRPVYKLIVKDKHGNETPYTVKVIKMIAYIFMNKKSNVDTDPNYQLDTELNKILSHEENFEFQMEEPTLKMLWFSQAFVWKNFIVNVDGVDNVCAVTDPALQGYAVGKIAIPFDRGQTKTITIKIGNNEVVTENDNGNKKVVPLTGNLAREIFTFKVTRLDKTIHIPASYLKIAGKNILKNNPGILEKLHSNDNIPEFVAGDPCIVKIGLKTKSTKVTINGTDLSDSLKSPNGELKTYSSPELEIKDFKTAPKEVTIVVTPEDQETYKETTWKFHLVYLEPNPVPVSYEINGVPNERLPYPFQEAVEDGGNPLISVHSKNFNLKIVTKKEITKVEVGGQSYEGDKIKKVNTGLFSPPQYVVLHTETLTNGSKDISIKVTPKESFFSAKQIKFRVVKEDKNEKMNPVLEKIGNNNDFSSDFIKGLTETNSANYKTYQFNGSETKAKILISLSAYEKNFLLKTLKIDGTLINEDGFKNHPASSYPPSPEYYTVEKEIEGISASEKEVKIEFEGKDNVDSVTWNFKIKNGGAIPTIPQRKLKEFSINGQGSALGNPLPAFFADHLTDNTLPTLEIYGHKAAVKCVAEDRNTFAEVDFEIGSNKETKTFDEGLAKPVAEHEFDIAGSAEHTIKITFKPKSTTDFSPLIYSFKLKSIQDKPQVDCLFFIENEVRSSGHKEVLNAEYVTLMVQAEDGAMQSVQIGEENSLQNCNIQVYETKGKKIARAEREIALGYDTEKTWLIKVTPVDSSKFAETTCKLHLKGTKLDGSNAEFAFYPNGFPKVQPQITEWVPGITQGYADDLGTKKATITAKTLSPRVKVKYQIVDVVTLNPMANTSEVQLTSANNDVNFKSNDIELYTDKPTKVKVWVESETGNLKDDARGSCYLTFNPVTLWWGYIDTDNIEHFRTRGYDEITIDPSKVKGGKIYIMITPWSNYTVEGFTDKGELGKEQQKWWTAVDVSELVSASGSAEKDFSIELKLKGVTCFTYKLKIKKN